MELSAKERALIARIAKRFTSEDMATYRSVGRSIAHQVLARRGDIVRALRGTLGELAEHVADERRRGYREALEDVLIAAEAAIEPEEEEARAVTALAHAPELRKLLDYTAANEVVLPSDAAACLGKSPATGTRRIEQLRSLGLIVALPSLDDREHPHRATELGLRLASVSPAPKHDVEPMAVGNESRTEARGQFATSERVSSPAPVPIEGALERDEFLSLLDQQGSTDQKPESQPYVLGFELGRAIGSARGHSIREWYRHMAASLAHSLPTAAKLTAMNKIFVLVPKREREQALKLALKLMGDEQRIAVHIARPDAVSHELKQAGSHATGEVQSSSAMVGERA